MNPFSHYYYDFLGYCSCEVGKKDWSEDIEGAAEEYVSNNLQDNMYGQSASYIFIYEIEF